MGARATIEAWTSYRRNVADDSEYHCSGCNKRVRKGAALWWTEPHHEYGDCDAYCQSCALETAQGHAAMVAAIESGDLRP